MNKPRYQAVVVVTIDGKIAKHANHNVNWSSPEDKRFLHQKIKESDVIIIGRKTFEVAKKALTKKEFITRNYIVLTRSVKNSRRLDGQTLLVNPSKVDINQMIIDLGCTKVCILGGTKTYGLMLRMNLIDDLFITIEPMVFGSGQGIFDFVGTTRRFILKSIKSLNKEGTILLHYQKNKH
ncbi:MAG: dihydrofolate reductase family protein [Candidatus Buchananbacteria bacterium]|nr:dihydrofolate reductase family protein [Candidatus Buchananbacteria bacterium]